MPHLTRSSAFKRLDSDLLQLRLSLPREYQIPEHILDRDHRRPVVSTLPQLATILLHEPFCVINENDPSMGVCMHAARSIMESIHVLRGTSFEVAQLSPFLNFIWGVAGREFGAPLHRRVCADRVSPLAGTFVRAIAISQYRGVTVGVQELYNDVFQILAALDSHPSPLGCELAPRKTWLPALR